MKLGQLADEISFARTELDLEPGLRPPAEVLAPGPLTLLAHLYIAAHYEIIEIMYGLVYPGLSAQTQNISPCSKITFSSYQTSSDSGKG